MRQLIALWLLGSSCISWGQVTEMSVFNDSWGGGFTPITDDLRSYGLQLAHRTAHQSTFLAKYSALTNLYALQLTDRLRTDVLSLRAEFPLWYSHDENNVLLASLGGYLHGRLVGDWVQNLVHNIFEVNPVDLPYNQAVYFAPAVGFALRKRLKHHRIDHTWSLSLGLDLSGEYAHQYRLTSNWALPFSLKSINNNQATLQLSYNFLHAHREDELLRRVFRAESGWQLSLQGKFRSFFYYLDIYPGQRFSSGGFGLRLTPRVTRPALKKAQRLSVAIGVLSDGYGLNFKYGWLLFQNWKRPVRLLVNHTFNTRYLSGYADQLSHGKLLAIGLESDLLESRQYTRLLSPYINASVGRRTVSIYSPQEKNVQTHLHQVAALCEQGINFHLPLKALNIRESLRFTLYHRLLFLPGGRELDMGPANRDRFASWQSQWGAAAIFLFD